ncbi:MAG: hypothetical protein BWY99_01938 [Synergistetes bacterium ADurb.BinA166]|nr:MAG: hypothetical protein BWY99_01938 [Synergistetes bacterium ADurb.BinA166]
MAYRVVVFPDPVGPVNRISPCGFAIRASILSLEAESIPSCSSESSPAPLSSMRRAMRSPCCTGIELTRMSTARLPTVIPMRPSCGARRSAMSMRAMTFILLVRGACWFLGRRSLSCSTPSTLNLMRTSSSNGSTCISVAPILRASLNRPLTSFITGTSTESLWTSSLSRSSASSIPVISDRVSSPTPPRRSYRRPSIASMDSRGCSSQSASLPKDAASSWALGKASSDDRATTSLPSSSLTGRISAAFRASRLTFPLMRGAICSISGSLDALIPNASPVISTVS